MPVDGGRSIPRIPYFNIGVMYSVADETMETPSVQGVEFGAAIMMAINEINDKHDGIEDELLPHTPLRLVVKQPRDSFTDGAVQAVNMRAIHSDDEVIACIGPQWTDAMAGMLFNLHLLTAN